MPTDTQLVLRPLGPFSLDPLRSMACGFLRGTRSSNADGSVTLAFPHDTTFAPVAATLRMQGDDVHVDLSQADPDGVMRRQVERFLGLDVDARPFADLVSRDPVLAPLWEKRPGFRPPAASSPYAMAGWCVLSQRAPMAQAARLQQALGEAFGDRATTAAAGAGPALPSFPRPESLLARNGFRGISDEKWRRLQAIAAAALDGELDVATLVSLDPDAARARLRRIRGIGAWTAEAILVRGCAPTDLLPLGEPSLHVAFAAAAGLDHTPNDEELLARTEPWRPFRTWASVLLIASLGRTTSATRGAPPATKKPTKPLPPQIPLFLGVGRPQRQVA